MGLGFLYLGVGRPHIVDFMVQQIEAKHVSHSPYRWVYSLCAGLGLGLVLLGSASSAQSQKSSDGQDPAHPGFAGSDTERGGMSIDQAQSRGMNLEITSRLLRLVEGGRAGPQGGRGKRIRDPSQPQVVREPPYVHTLLTQPGAIYALALIYMQSNNQEMARLLRAPDTMYELESGAPDTYIMRTTAVAIIDWDRVQPTCQWIQDQIPAVLDRGMRTVWTGADPDSAIPSLDNTPLRRRPVRGADGVYAVADRDGISQYHICTLTGACLGMGLRYAGTADRQARDVLMRQVRWQTRTVHTNPKS